MRLTRRGMLVGGAAFAAAGLPLSHLFRRRTPGRTGRFGPLKSDPRGVLDLPEGFSYRLLQKKGERMNDGYHVPGAFDGMACFPGSEGQLVLLRNHELDWVGLPSPYLGGQAPPEHAYDPDALGGVTRLVLDATSLAPISSNLVLAGTVRNCAGGESPWGWLSCEETTKKNHGYVFLCRPHSERAARPERIDGYGRFRHEAVALDPRTLAAYLTEDEPDGCFYRFVPRDEHLPFEGRLQALRIPNRDGFDASTEASLGRPIRVDWVDVADPSASSTLVREQARSSGAAVFKRGEGAWFLGGDVFFVSTTGGREEAGQVFRLRVGVAGEPDALVLLAEATNPSELNMPDNVTIAPWGDVFLAEDSIAGPQHLRIVTSDGMVSDFARNAASRSELAGVCFSPGGETLFVNLYMDGLTLAIRGPFRSA